MENLDGHETGNGGYCQGDTYGNSPFLDPTMNVILTDFIDLLKLYARRFGSEHRTSRGSRKNYCREFPYLELS
jgi:hypothetical protein